MYWGFSHQGLVCSLALSHNRRHGISRKSWRRSVAGVEKEIPRAWPDAAIRFVLSYLPRGAPEAPSWAHMWSPRQSRQPDITCSVILPPTTHGDGSLRRRTLSFSTLFLAALSVPHSEARSVQGVARSLGMLNGLAGQPLEHRPKPGTQAVHGPLRLITEARGPFHSPNHP